MKKNWFFVVMGILILLAFTATQVLASPADSAAYARTPDRTPGARATENAERRATQNRGNGQGEDRGGNPHGERLNFKGVVVSADAASLTITLEDGSSITFILTDETCLRIPTLGDAATAADLQPGLQVHVQAVTGEDGALTARAVQVIPGKPLQSHRVGTVTDYQPGVSITIQAADGNAYTYRLSADTPILPQERQELLTVGARVTIIAPRQVTTLDLTAQGIVVHPAQTAP
jgi:hypothetical protein